jgi:hypothetical protein
MQLITVDDVFNAVNEALAARAHQRPGAAKITG